MDTIPSEHDVDPRTEIRELRARLARLEDQVGAGEPTAPAAERVVRVAPEPDQGGSVSRRRLLGMAGAATAGAVGATVLASSPAGATTGAMQFGTANDAGTDITSLAASGTDKTLDVTNSTSGDAIHGTAGAGSGDGVVGTSPAANGVAGNSTSGTGVSGSSSSGGGVVATSTSGVAVVAAIGVAASAAHLELVPGSASGPPSSSPHNKGQFYLDSTGALWQCIVTGTPGTWVRQSSLVTLPAPSRVYDSRPGQANPSGSPQGPLAFGAGARTINCSPTTPALPATAITLLCNLTVAGSAGPTAGALLMWAAGATEPNASSINWSGPGVVIANAVTSACDASQDVQVKCVASAGSSTNFIIDVVGYYL